MKTHTIVLKTITSAKGNDWKVKQIYTGNYCEHRIVRKKDGLVLDYGYYGPYVDWDNGIQDNIEAIKSGINLKEWQS